MIGPNNGQFLNLGQVLVSCNCTLSVFGDENLKVAEIADQKYLSSCSSDSDFLDFLELNKKSLLAMQSLFVWNSDESTRLVARSPIDEEIKAHILPIKNPKYWNVHGSKVGQVMMFAALNVSQPKSFVANTPDEILQWAESFAGDFIVKADKYGGGAFVRKFTNQNKSNALNVPCEWFPVVVEEFIEGPVASIEAMYINGRLAFFLYAHFSLTEGEFGPSVTRIYRNNSDDALTADLIKLGESLKYDGFTNISCIFDITKQKHFFIEFDCRPNHWSHLFHFFGIDFVKVLNDDQTIGLQPQIDESDQIRLYAPDRLFNYSLKRGRLLYALKAARGSRISNLGDPMPFNRTAFRPVRQCVRILIFNPILRALISIKSVLPAWIQQKIHESKLKNLLLKVVFQN